MRRFLVLVVLLSACSSSATAVVDMVGASQADRLVGDSAAVLDIRTPEEFAEGHIEGAINIDFYAADFADRIGALDPEAVYLVYCRSGNRSGQAIDLFRDLGFVEVHEIEGGILTWVGEGLPLVGG
jgi:rhodanese-related sulfurtransferase